MARWGLTFCAVSTSGTANTTLSSTIAMRDEIHFQLFTYKYKASAPPLAQGLGLVTPDI